MSPPTNAVRPALIEISHPATALMEIAMSGEEDLVAARLARGCRCFAICEEGAVAAYGWLSRDPEWIGEVGVEIRPGPGEAYIWNCLTLPARRRTGLFRALLVEVAARARADGCSRIWIGSLEGSAESAVAGTGFQPVLRLTVTERAGVRRISSTPARNATVETSAAAMTALGLRRPSELRRVQARRH